MKHNIFVAALGSALLFLGACSEGQYWDEPSNYGSNPVFIKAAQTMNLNADDEVPATINVTLSRAEAGAALTVPVTVTPGSTASAMVFSGPEEVTFEAGSNTVEYPLAVDAENFAIGVNYSVTLEITQPEDAAVQRPEGNFTYTLKLMQDYTWVSAGNAMCVSAWVGSEDPIAVPVQEAAEYAEEGQRLFRLVSPYYVMEPDYAENGYNLQFITTTAGEAVLFPGWQEIGEEGENSEWFYLGTGYTGCSFYSEDNIYTIAGVMAYTEGKDGTSLRLYTFETFAFDWTCPAK